MCLLEIGISSLKRCLLKSFAHFNQVFTVELQEFFKYPVYQFISTNFLKLDWLYKYDTEWISEQSILPGIKKIIL